MILSVLERALALAFGRIETLLAASRCPAMASQPSPT